MCFWLICPRLTQKLAQFFHESALNFCLSSTEQKAAFDWTTVHQTGSKESIRHHKTWLMILFGIILKEVYFYSWRPVVCTWVGRGVVSPSPWPMCWKTCAELPPWLVKTWWTVLVFAKTHVKVPSKNMHNFAPSSVAGTRWMWLFSLKYAEILEWKKTEL